MSALGHLSDGYHTFDELYDHRITLWIALCRTLEESLGDERLNNVSRWADRPWRTELHSDGSRFDGWFVLGMGINKGAQMTYHLPMARWGECDFARTLDHAPEFDGHTSADVLLRIKAL